MNPADVALALMYLGLAGIVSWLLWANWKLENELNRQRVELYRQGEIFSKAITKVQREKKK